MIKLSYFKELNINITWTLLSINFIKDLPFLNEISVHEIIDYAIQMLQTDSIDNKDKILELACEKEENYNTIIELITFLSKNENNSIEKELIKWKACYLWNSIKVKSDDFIAGLCELNDAWIHIGIDAEDCPHMIQGVYNEIPPLEYYTVEMYDLLYEKSINWILEKVKA